MTDEEKHKQHLEQLKDLNEGLRGERQQIELYQARISRAYNKKAKIRTFKKGNLVLAIRRPMQITHKSKGKFQPKWKGLFVVEFIYYNGAYRLTTAEGDILMMTDNSKY